MRIFLTSLFVAGAFLFLVTACSRSPRITYYTLVSPPVAAGTPVHPAYVVAVGPVSVPELLDRPNLVVRRGPHRRDILETHRWADPLADGIAGAMAASLTHLLPQAQIVVMSGNEAVPDYRVQLQLQQWDAAPGEGVTLDLLWSVTGSGSLGPKSGRRIVKEPVHGSDYESLVAATSRALATIAGDVATVLQKSQGVEMPAAGGRNGKEPMEKMEIGK